MDGNKVYTVLYRTTWQHDYHNFYDHILFGVFPTLEAARVAIEQRTGLSIEKERPVASDDPRLRIKCGHQKTTSVFIVQESGIGQDVLPSDFDWEWEQE